jgi:PAS domain-containing protein
MTKREEIIGRDLFEVFPDNPEDPPSNGVSNLRVSLLRVIAHRRADIMAVQKYDIGRPLSEGGAFEEHHWSPVNSPVFAKDGELAYIIHRVEDVTGFVRLKQAGSEDDEFIHPDDRAATLAAADNVSEGQSILAFENRYRSRNGSSKWLLWSAIPSVEEGVDLRGRPGYHGTETGRGRTPAAPTAAGGGQQRAGGVQLPGVA